MGLCVVQKPFLGAGDNYVRDQLVDSDIFRNGDVLISQRYLRPATRSEIDNAYEAGDAEQKPIKHTSSRFKIPRRRRAKA